jgi:hypothetical protein
VSFDRHRDGFVLALLVVMLLMLAAALSGAYRLFAYALVAFLGMLIGLGFVRRTDRATWIAPLIATTVLFLAFTGMFLNEHAAVHDAGDTLLGFQPGTAFLVYGIWIPAFFTMGLSFALLFDRLTHCDRR